MLSCSKIQLERPGHSAHTWLLQLASYKVLQGLGIEAKLSGLLLEKEDPVHLVEQMTCSEAAREEMICTLRA